MITNGYDEMAAPDDYPGKRYRKNRIYTHHYVWYINTGYILEKNEVIHHKNGIKNDNRFENLELSTRSEHTNAHLDRTIAMVMFECPCGKIFERRRNKTHLVSKTSKSTYCSRTCAGRYGQKNIKSKLIKQWRR